MEAESRKSIIEIDILRLAHFASCVMTRKREREDIEFGKVTS